MLKVAKLWYNYFNMKISRKKENALVFFKNLAMTTTVFSIVLILVFLTQGWRLDEKFEVQQTGLVQFNSSVLNSIAEIDKKKLSEGTPTKILAKPGNHEFSIWKEGYKTWWRRAEVKVGEILWLNYARLVPKQLNEKSFLNILNLKSAQVSPDKKKIFAISEDNNGEAAFWLIDISLREPKISRINFNSNIFERDSQNNKNINQTNFYKIAENLQFSKASNDNKKALLSFKNGNKLEWLILNFENPDESINLTQKFHIDFSKIIPSNDELNKLIGISGSDLREINLSNSTISAAILSDVVDFELYDKENIVYIEKKTTSNDFSVGLRKNDKNIKIAKNIKDQPKIAIGRYYRESYVYIGQDSKIDIYKSASWTEKMHLTKTLNLKFSPDYLKLNGESRIMVAKKGKDIYSFDIETRNEYQFLASNDSKIKWLDDFILGDFEGERMAIHDFDGMNKQVLSRAISNLPFTLSNDNKYIYSFIQNNSGGYSLNRLKMTIEE